jgi:hypothetical protein
MSIYFPELTSFGTLLSFALSLEEAAAELAQGAAQSSEGKPWCGALEICATKHKKRGQQLEILRRERLNEVVLQSISGMDRAQYLPALDLPSDGAQAALAVVAVEETAARFYDAAAAKAVEVLGGLERTLRKLSQENRSLADSLRRDAM